MIFVLYGYTIVALLGTQMYAAAMTNCGRTAISQHLHNTNQKHDNGCNINHIWPDMQVAYPTSTTPRYRITGQCQAKYTYKTSSIPVFEQFKHQILFLQIPFELGFTEKLTEKYNDFINGRATCSVKRYATTSEIDAPEDFISAIARRIVSSRCVYSGDFMSSTYQLLDFHVNDPTFLCPFFDDNMAPSDPFTKFTLDTHTWVGTDVVTNCWDTCGQTLLPGCEQDPDTGEIQCKNEKFDAGVQGICYDVNNNNNKIAVSTPCPSFDSMCCKKGSGEVHCTEDINYREVQVDGDEAAVALAATVGIDLRNIHQCYPRHSRISYNTNMPNKHNQVYAVSKECYFWMHGFHDTLCQRDRQQCLQTSDDAAKSAYEQIWQGRQYTYTVDWEKSSTVVVVNKHVWLDFYSDTNCQYYTSTQIPKLPVEVGTEDVNIYIVHHTVKSVSWRLAECALCQPMYCRCDNKDEKAIYVEDSIFVKCQSMSAAEYKISKDDECGLQTADDVDICSANSIPDRTLTSQTCKDCEDGRLSVHPFDNFDYLQSCTNYQTATEPATTRCCFCSILYYENEHYDAAALRPQTTDAFGNPVLVVGAAADYVFQERCLRVPVVRIFESQETHKKYAFGSNEDKITQNFYRASNSHALQQVPLHYYYSHEEGAQPTQKACSELSQDFEFTHLCGGRPDPNEDNVAADAVRYYALNSEQEIVIVDIVHDTETQTTTGADGGFIEWTVIHRGQQKACKKCNDAQYNHKCGSEGGSGSCKPCLTDTAFNKYLSHELPDKCNGWHLDSHTAWATKDYDELDCSAVILHEGNYFLCLGCGAQGSTKRYEVYGDNRVESQGKIYPSLTNREYDHDVFEKCKTMIPYCPAGYHIDTNCATLVSFLEKQWEVDNDLLKAWQQTCCTLCTQCSSTRNEVKHADWRQCTGSSTVDTQRCADNCEVGQYVRYDEAAGVQTCISCLQCPS